MPPRLAKVVLMVGLTVLATAAAKAEIVKIAVADCQTGRTCFYWWPKLPKLAGWHTDEEANYAYGDNGMNSLVPDGSTFSNADTVMYAASTFKERYKAENPNSKSLDAFIQGDKATFAALGDHVAIKEADPLTTGDGEALRSFTYFRPKDGTWERVSYGAEGDYYLVFTISAHSEAGYRKNQSTYENLIKRYHK